MKILFRFFILSFLFLFSFQRIIDNERICGGIGTYEENCIFSTHSNLDTDPNDNHVCVNCPCNYTLISYSNLYLTKIYTQVSISYIISTFFSAVNYDYPLNIIRPPRSVSV